jgi:hypothetical protein
MRAIGVCIVIVVVVSALLFGRSAGYGTQQMAELVGLSSAKEVSCVLIQQGGVNSGGYGDHLRLTHRAELMAQVLGCEYLRAFTESGHGYASSNLFSHSSAKINLAGLRTCDVASVLNVAQLESDNHDCTPPIIGDASQCDVFTYSPRTLLYNSNKLACVADRLRTKMEVARTRQHPCHATGYAALHYRYGDLAGHAGDFRTTGVAELNDAIDMIHTNWGFKDSCVVIFAESYPNATINGVTGGHRVDNNTDVSEVMADMAGATVLFGAASGFMLPITLLFAGKEIIVPPGVTNRFLGLPRAGVKISETSVEMHRNWPVRPGDH